MINIDPINIYTLTVKIISAWLLIAMAIIAGIGYLWRSRFAIDIPVSRWIFNIKAVIILVLFIPFYLIIYFGELPIIQLQAMSRVIFFSLLLVMNLSHINVCRKYRSVKSKML